MYFSMFRFLILIFCCLSAPLESNGFALRLYSSYGRDPNSLRSKIQPKLAAGNPENPKPVALSTALQFPGALLPQSAEQSPDEPAVRRPKPWEDCGEYANCKRILINYLERVLRLKRLLDVQSKVLIGEGRFPEDTRMWGCRYVGCSAPTRNVKS